MAKFADDVTAGRKNFTIRADRKRHARPGEPVQLYTGMRTRSCRKLVDPDPVCEKITPIIIYRVRDDRCLIVLNEITLRTHQTNYIVAIDGFKSHKEFMQFHLGDARSIKKIFIQWGFWNV
tara:strand:+ start:719 stop:1081 length:363 start_codon:yes stop_codon:yes gene_type:complete